MTSDKPQDLWPSDLATNLPRTPLAVIKEQASLLARKVNGLLYAEVRTQASENSFIHSFDIVVPSLDSYRHTLFTVHSKGHGYPCSIIMSAKLLGTFQNEKTLLEMLGTIFCSSYTVNLIKSLLVEANAQSPPKL